MAWLTTLKNQEVVISGDFRADFSLTKADMTAHAYEAGARSVCKDVRSTTDVFVRGRSLLYKHGDFGDKEAELARRVPHAVVIDGAGFLELCEGRRARCWAPNEAPVDEVHDDDAPDEIPMPLGVPFIQLDTDVATAAAKVFERDPDAVDRSLRAHRDTLNCLAICVEEAGYKALRADDPACAFDLAWETDTGVFVAEVKSLHGQNERAQLRLGLGQVLDYADWLAVAGREIAAVVLAVERAPTEIRWVGICARHNVTLVWPDTMGLLFA